MSLLVHRDKKRKERVEELDQLISNAAHDNNKQPRHRSCFRSTITQVRDCNGELVHMTPWISPWYLSYVIEPLLGDTKFKKTFDNGFVVHMKCIANY
jgi:hypothetical protein